MSERSNAPIDAEFEPADIARHEAKPEKKSRERPIKVKRGPGWFSFFLLFLIALGGLGLSLWSTGLLEQTNLPTPAETNVATIQDSQEALQTRVGELASQVEGMIDRVDSEIDRLETQIAELEPTGPVDLEGEAAAAIQEQLSALDQQVSALQEAAADDVDPARVEAIESALEAARRASGGATNEQVVSLSTQLETLKTELASLQQSQTAFREELEAIRSDADAIGRSSAQVVSASLALAAIEATAGRGEPFEAQFAQLAEARPEDPDVAALASLSRIGIPPLSELKTEFRRLSHAALSRDTEEAAGLGWVNTVFGDSVSIRRTDAASETADRLADAQAALARDDLRIAIEAVEALPEAVRPVFQTWLADARRRARLEDSLEDLRLKLIAAGQ